MFHGGSSFDREATRFITIFAGGTLLLGLMSVHLGWIGVMLTSWCAYFFRDPNRITPSDDGSVLVSPADGQIVKIGRFLPPVELGLDNVPMQRISIFMSIFNVHVNRAPVAGVVERISYTPGKFLNATLDKASEHNEREAVLVRTFKGDTVVYVRIAGLIARRIRRDIHEGDTLKLGQRIGIIRFGSRVDVYLPEGAVLTVDEGQTMVAGETVIARLMKEAEAYAV
ncbi:MAG: phosphatidylserine decarboxylase [Holosporales bacterium]|jgi:phosphatidylserine decarboxylase|nr:phosphatidylserine decarboxylase [Holosporales bacterium]